MRELTEAEKEALKATYSWVDTHNNTKYQIYTIGFSNGLEVQDSRIVELEQQLKDATDKLERLGFGNYTELPKQLIALSSKFGPLNKVSLVKAARTINPSLGLAEAVNLVRELFGDELDKVVVR